MNSRFGPDQCYANFLQQGEFHIQRCDDCHQHVFYPRCLCPHCGSESLIWTRPSGLATVYSTSVARQQQGDYNIALVDLQEGPRMMTRVVGIDPQQVTIGMQVQAFVDTLEGDCQPLVLFRPLDDSSRGGT